MRLGKFLFTAALAALAAPAAAAVTTVGSSSARLCFEAAETPGLPTIDQLGRCNEALVRDPLSSYDTVATLVNRGILKLRLGRIEDSIADFDKAIALDGNQPEAYLNKGMALLRRPEGATEALPLFDTALAKRTRRPAIAYYGRAVAHEINGDVRNAYRDYRQASLLEPKWRDPQAELARFTLKRQ